eukprot:198400-Amphidinium_carterae.1
MEKELPNAECVYNLGMRGRTSGIARTTSALHGTGRGCYLIVRRVNQSLAIGEHAEDVMRQLLVTHEKVACVIVMLPRIGEDQFQSGQEQFWQDSCGTPNQDHTTEHDK